MLHMLRDTALKQICQDKKINFAEYLNNNNKTKYDNPLNCPKVQIIDIWLSNN